MYGSTGFPDVDVLIADDTALPCGEERHYSERIYRVRHTYLPFQMFYETPDVTAPPSLQTGHITFGSLNSAYKLTPETLQAWSRILHTIPTARLLLRNAALDHVSNRADLLARFAGLNIAAERLSLLGRADHMSFLRTYDQIDVALDAFPYNGGTTTVEALWQGVPVLTIDGDRWAARTSRSILTAAGLADWVAADLPSRCAPPNAAGSRPVPPVTSRPFAVSSRNCTCGRPSRSESSIRLIELGTTARCSSRVPKRRWTDPIDRPRRRKRDLVYKMHIYE
jgi:predicted O-linked N-acetylglucosamine transferase (SPINDLY family)